jgi:hypothetical protein
LVGREAGPLFESVREQRVRGVHSELQRGQVEEKLAGERLAGSMLLHQQGDQASDHRGAVDDGAGTAGKALSF